MQQRYQVLRLVQSIYRVLAWIGAVVGVILALIALVTGGQVSPYMGGGGGAAAAFVAFLLILLATALYWVSMMAAAEWISVIIDTEENTRNTAALLRTMQPRAAGQPPEPGPAPM